MRKTVASVFMDLPFGFRAWPGPKINRARARSVVAGQEGPFPIPLAQQQACHGPRYAALGWSGTNSPPGLDV